MPMRLFRNSIFSIANVFGFLIGVAMFGALIFIPVYLQVVDGMSPTQSGLAMLPMIVGHLQHLDRRGPDDDAQRPLQDLPDPRVRGRGRRRCCCSRSSTATSPYWFAALSMYVMGAGLGFTMQVLVTIVQNSVDRGDIGVATSSVTFFRQMGGSFGTALFGAILSSRLAVHIADAMREAPEAPPPAPARSATWPTTCRRSRRCPSRCTA